MKKENNFSKKALLWTIAIVLLAFASLVIVDMLVPFRRRMLFDLLPIIGSLSFLIIAFSLVLIYTYLKDYFELKNTFTLALLLAVISFLMFGISSNPLVHLFFGAYGRITFFNILPYLFAAIALGILAWISTK